MSKCVISVDACQAKTLENYIWTYTNVNETWELQWCWFDGNELVNSTIKWLNDEFQ